jgi:16S rRNA G1207 methylase RsmC
MDLDLKHDLQRQVGLSEREIAPFFIQHSHRIDTAVDVGAGDGYYTLYFLAKTPAKRVYAFEPSSSAMSALERNASLNGFRPGDRLVLSSQFVRSNLEAGGTSLDAIAPTVTPPCTVKIDVEGMEADVLSSASHLLSMPGILWIIETHSPRVEEECRARLGSFGYDTHLVSQSWWRLILPELRPIPHNRWLIGRPQ